MADAFPKPVVNHTAVVSPNEADEETKTGDFFCKDHHDNDLFMYRVTIFERFGRPDLFPFMMLIIMMISIMTTMCVGNEILIDVMSMFEVVCVIVKMAMTVIMSTGDSGAVQHGDGGGGVVDDDVAVADSILDLLAISLDTTAPTCTDAKGVQETILAKRAEEITKRKVKI